MNMSVNDSRSPALATSTAINYRWRDARQHLATTISRRRRTSAMVMACIALLALLFRRSNYDSTILMAVESSVASGLIVGSQFLLKRFPKLDPKFINSLCIALVTIVPWLTDRTARIFGLGTAMEIVVLSSLAWVALATAMLGQNLRTIGISVICSGFLTLFVTCIADSRYAIAFAYCWGILCLWWLIANHWEKIETCAAVDIRKSSQHRLLMIFLGSLAFAVASWSIAGRIPVLKRLQAELMPTSGGTRDNDIFATSGVGDGEVLVAAKENPQSFGAVDTDFFLESHEPSLFDVISEQFGEPRTKDRWESAQSLDNKNLKEQDSRVAEGNRSSSQSFSIDREPPKTKKPLNDLKSAALMFWIGRSGISLATERFDVFKSNEWKKSSDDAVVEEERKEPSPLVIGQRTWFQHPRFGRDRETQPYVGADRESLKFTKFRSPTIPTHNSLQLWHIDKIDRADFFDLSDDDCLSMVDRQFVPDYTTLHFINSEMDREWIERHAITQSEEPYDSDLDQSIDDKLLTMIERWTAGKSPGWKRITSIIDGLRSDFEFDRQFAPDSKQPLLEFLQRQRGSDYMFATTAAVMLRQIGYPTRLVTGFHIKPDGFNSLAAEKAILADDAHVWLEVQLSDDVWIPLEPTPGYQQPLYRVSLWYRMRHAFPTLVSIAFGCAAFLLVIWYFRRSIFEAYSRLLWFAVGWMDDRMRIGWLLFILDTRSKLIDQRRPHNVTARQWYSGCLNRIPTDGQFKFSRFFDEADQIYFGSSKQLSEHGQQALRSLWIRLTSERLERDRA